MVDRLVMVTRFAVFSAPEGSIEVTLTASADEFAALHLFWTAFSNSLRIQPNPLSRAPK